MRSEGLRQPLYVAAGYNTTFFGPGRPEFDPRQPMPPFESYLQEAAKGCLAQLPNAEIDEGVIGNFMAPRFLHQANLPGLLPFVVPALLGKPCTGVEGACGSGGRALATAARIVLSEAADVVFVLAFEVQNGVKSVYGADILAGAGYYRGMRKQGLAHFFPGLFSERAGAYYAKYGRDFARRGMARWYEQAILNARCNPKAQEYTNTTQDLYQAALGAPCDGQRFVPHLSHLDCSKVTDGASALVVASEEGLSRLGLVREQAIQIMAIGASEADITQAPADPTRFSTTATAVAQALEQAAIGLEQLALLEIHDCFSVGALLALEAIGVAEPGKAPLAIEEGLFGPEGKIPTNPSGGLIGFGHPVGASGVRQMVDLWGQFTGQAANPILPSTPYGMMVSMGGNDVTVTAIIVSLTS